MRAEQRRNYASRPALGRVMDRSQRFQFRFRREPVPRLRLHGGGALSCHLLERGQNVVCKILARSFSHRLQAGPDPPASRGDVLVCCAGNASFKIDQARPDECGMRVRVHEAGQDDLTRTVDFANDPSVVLQPTITGGILRLADGNNLATGTEYGGIFDDGKIGQVPAAPGSGGSRAQRQ